MTLYEWLRRIDFGTSPYLLDVVTAGFSATAANNLHFHNGDYLSLCLGALKDCFFPEKIQVAYALAVAWQDAVYVPGSPGGLNEDLSCTRLQASERYYRLKAIAAEKMSKEDDTHLMVKTLVGLGIRATSTDNYLSPKGDVGTSSPDVQTFCNRLRDVNLSYLANPNYNGFLLSQAKQLAETYDELYWVSLGDIESYLRSRLNFFEKLTSRRNIFMTQEAWHRYEETSRLNIKQFVTALQTEPKETCKLLVSIAKNYEQV